MHSPYVRAISRILVVCLSAVSFHAHAGLIGSGEVVASAQAQAVQVHGMRAALAGQFEALGIAADTARDRVAALSDAEVAQLMGRLDGLPAGATGGLAFGVAFVIVFLIWRFNFSDQSKAEAKSTSKEPAKEPAKKE